MKANELMIGDLVNLSPGKANIPNYVMIHAIDYDNHVSKDNVFDIVFLSTGLVQYNYSIRSLKPIPLTPEILEKNGFVACQFWHEYKDGNITIQACIPSIRMKNDPCELVIEGGIHYVHQLQHALRLCGIEKEITI